MGKRKNNRIRPQEPQELKPSGQTYAAGAASLAFPRTVTAAWVYLMFTLFPLIYHDYYFDILETKTRTFSWLTAIMIVLMCGWGIFSGEFAKAFKSEEKFGLSLTDWSMLIFWIVAGISTLGAGKYMRQAFTGEEGRYVGFAFITTITLAYFLVTRYLKFSKHMVTAFLCTEILLCLFGITDFYSMNLLHFKDNIKAGQETIFFSTIGNINSYTVMVGFAVVISGVLFIMSRESVKRRLFYLVTLLISMTALTMGSSDNGYLTLMVFFGLVPFTAFRDLKSTARYFAVLAAYFTNIARIWHVEQVRTEKGLPFIKIDGLFNVIAKLSFLPVLILVLWVIAAIFYYADHRISRRQKDGGQKTDRQEERAQPETVERVLKVMRIFWLLFAILVVGVIAALFIKANSMEAKEVAEKFGALEHYLYFDDEWGNQRGYAWRACLEEFSELSLFKKLVGTGPDCFSVQMLLHRYLEMKDTTGLIYDSAHNEFLQYLYTVGLLGLISYVGQLAGAVVSAFRTALRTENKEGVREPYFGAYYWAFGFTVIGYALQSVVNINIPVASPLLWVFIALAEAAARENKAKSDAKT